MADQTNPYRSLPQTAFWKPSVAERSLFDLADLWSPRFDVTPDEPVVTFGSCFAQHIGRQLEARGFNWMGAEPPPPHLSATNAKHFNYNVFSARTGNIYTTSLLLQWTRWALGHADVPDETWEQDGRCYDPFRPAVEPRGFASAAELRRSREVAIDAFATCIRTCRTFVFTMGLTESWWNRKHGYEYPTCPGTVAGRFDPSLHVFENQDYGRIAVALSEAMDLIRSVNPGVRFILTVSPVPLTATMSGNHVVVATMESKSILRAVAGAMRRAHDDVDYFPSYEIINSPVVKGSFFEPNQREVNPYGVRFVMEHFFGTFRTNAATTATAIPAPPSREDLVCEEELLEAFGNVR